MSINEASKTNSFVTNLSNTSIQIKKYIDDMEVLETGILHLLKLDNVIKIHISNLILEFHFKENKEVSELNVTAETIGNNKVVLTLTNFNNELGEGILQPTELGIVNGTKLFFTFLTHSIVDKRSFSYTILAAKG